MKLDDLEHTTDADGTDVYVIHHEAGDIVLRIVHDDDCYSPLSHDAGDGLPALAMIEDSNGRTNYAGTADDVPYFMTLTCEHCEGSGYVPHGSPYAFDGAAPPDEDGEVTCMCSGSGEADTNDVGEYLRRTRGAVASLEIDVGSHGEQRAVIYWTAEDVLNPESALHAYVEEYKRWEDGDCWGYVCEGPASEDSCWGFIGREYAEEEAAGALKWAIESADSELVESNYWLQRGVVTL